MQEVWIVLTEKFRGVGIIILLDSPRSDHCLYSSLVPAVDRKGLSRLDQLFTATGLKV